MFEDWENYFLMIGSAAGGLIGLLFVVATLTSGRETSTVMRGVNLYMSPTAIHFAVVLAISAAALAPRLSLLTCVLVIGLASLVGLANALYATLGIRALGKNADPPHWTDFWLYGASPTLLYAAIAAADVALALRAPLAAEAIAGLALLLLFNGIRNAWDLITWMAPRRNGAG